MVLRPVDRESDQSGGHASESSGQWGDRFAYHAKPRRWSGACRRRRHHVLMPEHPLPVHTWFTSPARSTADAAHAKELPLHLVLRILNHIDNVGDLARLTRASRLIYYMTLPRLYETVTLRSHAQIRFVDGRPEGYGSGSPFAMGLNTLVSRNFGDYVRSFRVVGTWREHDTGDYRQGRVPDNSMVLQIVLRAALDRMAGLRAFSYVAGLRVTRSRPR